MTALARPEAAGPPRVRPMMFTGASVRAILDGAKTQSRRVINPQPWDRCNLATWNAHKADPRMADPPPRWHRFLSKETGRPYAKKCPHGDVGDHLYVKETVRWDEHEDRAFYVADGAPSVIDGWPWKRPRLAAIHLPRGASRITLEITDVRVERLDDISEADAIAEGVTKLAEGLFEVEGAHFASARTAFHFAWDGINGRRAPSESNPWLWCISFRRCQ